MLNYFQTSSPLRFSMAGLETLLRACQGPLLTVRERQEDVDVDVSGRSPWCGQEEEEMEEDAG